MNIGTVIAEKRKEAGITQIELAEQMHVTRQTVSRWESGAAYPDIEKIPELAEILGVSCDELLGAAGKAEGQPAGGSAPSYKKAGRAVSRLLMSMVGKTVKFQFYDDEADIDLYDTPCIIKGFDGNFIRVEAVKRKESLEKLIAAATVLSVTVIADAPADEEAAANAPADGE